MARRKRNPLPLIAYLERVDEERREELDRFGERIGVEFKDHNLINRALSHKSYTNELGYGHNEQYEKLEFFGDGVLGLIVNEYLFKVFPDSEEGELAKIKSAVVSEASLAEAAAGMDLGEMILIGRGEARSRGAERPSLLADVLEAVTGAIFIDQGLPAARRFVLGYIESSIRQMSTEKSVGDAKSYLQEMVQKEFGVRPVYDSRRSSGPDHSRLFRMEVLVKGRKWGEGSGKSKKEAEQAAAENALEAWEKDPDKLRGRGRGGRDSGRRDRDRLETSSGGGRGAARRERNERDERDDRGRGRGGERPERERTPCEERGRRGGGSERSSSRGGASRRSARGRESERDVFVPPAEIDDPIAWAAGESYRPRAAARPASALDSGAAPAAGRGRRRRR